MRRRRGVGLGVTLVIVGLLAVVGFALAALTVGRLQLMANLQHKRHAHRLAMSAIEAALGKLNAQPQFGVNGSDPAILVPGGDPRNWGRLSFDPGEARPSVNNLAGLTAQGGVPAASVRLIAEGRYGGARETLEALVTQPVFPFAVASHGPIHSTQGLIVATLADDTPQGRQDLLSDPARFGKPANLLSNGTGFQSVHVLGPSTICGDLQTSGRVDLSGNPIQILGELREDQDPGAIPEIDLAQLLPTSPQIMAGAPSNSPTLRGAVVCNGPFVCTGNLKLEGASLYVRGDLTVGGELEGNGTLTVEGATHLRGSARLNTLGRVALVSRGDILLEGAGPEQTYFKGLVYTQGKLTAHGLLIYGCLLGGGPGPASGPQMDLQDCVVVQDTGPVVAVASAPSQGEAVMNLYDPNPEPGSADEGSAVYRVDARMASPNRIRLELSVPGPGGASWVFEVNPQDPRDIEDFRGALLQTFENAVNLNLLFQDAQREPGIVLSFSDAATLQTNLADLVNYLGTSTSATTLFDLNQFLRPNERLRLASCRRMN